MQQKFRWVLMPAVVATALAAASGSRGDTSSCPRSLTILSPVAGDTVRTPFPVRFRVTCVRVGRTGAHIEIVFGSPRSMRIRLQPGAEPNLAIVPRHPLLSGRRTLLFQLARADRTLLPGVRARFRVGPLTIAGPR
jgi:hypothetical protein